MRKQLIVLAASTTLLAAPAAMSADVGGQCFSGQYRSSLVAYPRPELEVEITRRYDEAVAASEAKPVIHGQHHLWTWANETKVSCGKAIGFLAGNEVNVEQINQCDCFYGVMFYLAN